jgi:hypothetical protein
MPFQRQHAGRPPGTVDILARSGRRCCDPDRVTAAVTLRASIAFDTTLDGASRWQTPHQPHHLHGGRSMSTNMVAQGGLARCAIRTDLVDLSESSITCAAHRSRRPHTSGFWDAALHSGSLCSNSTTARSDAVGRLCQRHHQALHRDRQGGPSTSALCVRAALRLCFRSPLSSSLRWTLRPATQDNTNFELAQPQSTT